MSTHPAFSNKSIRTLYVQQALGEDEILPTYEVIHVQFDEDDLVLYSNYDVILPREAKCLKRVVM